MEKKLLCSKNHRKTEIDRNDQKRIIGTLQPNPIQETGKTENERITSLEVR